jgi:hypothetical protein
MDLRFMIYDSLFLFLLAGCSQPRPTQRPPVVEPPKTAEQKLTQSVEDTAKVAPPASGPAFAPVRIGILPLTELSGPSEASQGGKLSTFVTLLDAFGSPMKAPGVLRFELYEYIPRSAQSKGPRLTLWPDIDLTAPAQNNKYWRDFLRAYEFELDTQASPDKTYILEVTCIRPDGKRLSSEYVLKNSP